MAGYFHPAFSRAGGCTRRSDGEAGGGFQGIRPEARWHEELGPRGGCLMRRMENSDFYQLRRLTEASSNPRQGALTPPKKNLQVDPRKLLKTQDRMTLCPRKKGDFAFKIAEIYANCTGFFVVMS